MLWVGIAGKGVNVVILDDGLDYKSEDLADNFVSLFVGLLVYNKIHVNVFFSVC